MRETIRLKIKKKYIRATYRIRRKKIYNENFSIISNNCWGGLIYQSYGMKYNSPTIGLFFMAEDYIKFLYDIKILIYKKLNFIKFDNSKYYEHFKGWKKFGDYPIGVIEGTEIEIHFLHYESERVALEKWNRRIKRINWDNIIYKFNDQNLCTTELITKFFEIPKVKKICFTANKYNELKTIDIRCSKNDKYIKASYEPIGKSRYVDINELINNLNKKKEG